MFRKKYRVICKTSEGIFTFTHVVAGLRFFHSVSRDLMKRWEEYAKEKTGLDNTVVNFMRIK